MLLIKLILCNQRRRKALHQSKLTCRHCYCSYYYATYKICRLSADAISNECHRFALFILTCIWYFTLRLLFIVWKLVYCDDVNLKQSTLIKPKLSMPHLHYTPAHLRWFSVSSFTDCNRNIFTHYKLYYYSFDTCFVLDVHVALMIMRLYSKSSSHAE